MPSAKKLLWRCWKRYTAAACTSLCGIGLRSFQCISFQRPAHQLQRTAPFWKPLICLDSLPKKAARHTAWQCIISYGSYWQFHTALLGLKGEGPSLIRFHCVAFIWNLRTSWVLMQHVVVNLYRRFGTTYRSHLQGSRNTKWISWPLKMEPTDCPETLDKTYHYMLRNNPEDCRSNLHRNGNLESRVIFICSTPSRKR